jgi:choline dehydrogenase-like flavoprotein
VAAWALAKAGHDVLVLEKGRNLLPGIGTKAGIGPIPFGNDDVKSGRWFENQDPVLEPRTSRSQSEAVQGVARSFTGDVNMLPATVGGGTVHWDAKVPRLWRQDFRGLTLYGPIAGANIADWPLTYDDLAPFYDEVEGRLGVQGDRSAMPAATLAQAPRPNPFPLPPNPPMLAGLRLAEGARRVGATAYPFPMAVNSRPFAGRPACNSCGFCSGFGCPILARGGAAASFLHPALLAGARLQPRAAVTQVDLAPGGARATGVTYVDEHGVAQHVTADVVILAASAIETARLLLVSGGDATGLGNRSGQVGRNLMFHHFTLGVGLFREDLHAWRGPSTTFTIDDFMGPDRSAAARASGLPYLKGGICEVGGGLLLKDELSLYTTLGTWGRDLKEFVRTSPLRVHLAGLSMCGEDLPQPANRVDLDPRIRDYRGQPVPRITHSAHKFELAASTHFGPSLAAVCANAPGVLLSGFLPLGNLADATGGFASPYAGLASTAHVMGTARMGDDPTASVVDGYGRLHDVDNVYVMDGSVFVSSGGCNPTLTIMALALRSARQLGGPPLLAPATSAVPATPITRGAGEKSGHVTPLEIALGAAGATVVAGASVVGVRRGRGGRPPSPSAQGDGDGMDGQAG